MSVRCGPHSAGFDLLAGKAPLLLSIQPKRWSIFGRAARNYIPCGFTCRTIVLVRCCLHTCIGKPLRFIRSCIWALATAIGSVCL